MEAEATLPQPLSGATLPLLEDELLAELADFSLHAWFDDFDSELPPLLIAPQPVLLSAAQASSAAPTTADTTTAGAGTSGISNTSNTSGTGVSPVTQTTSSTEPTSTFLVSGSFAAVSTETAADPVIASMALTRETDWDRQGGTATVSVEVYNGTGSAVAAGDYWVTFFVDRGVEGIGISEPTHAVPGLAPGETTDVPAVAAAVVIAAGAERELYHLRAALVTNPNAPPRDPAPLLVESVSDLSIHWTAHTTGGVQAMGGGQGGGVPYVELLNLAPFSIWTEISGSAYATASVCNTSGAPVIYGEYAVIFSVDLNPMGIDVPDPFHPVPGIEDNSCVPVPPWGGTPVDVSWTAVTGTYTVRATIPNVSTETHPLHVVAVNDWKVEWERPPGSGTWVDPDGQLPDGTDYLWTHDTRRWTALGISHPTLVTSIDWLFRAAGTTNPWQSYASATGNNPAEGDSLTEGDWEITPDVHFQGQGSAQMVIPKRFVLARLQSADWTPHLEDPAKAGERLLVGDEYRFFPEATTLGGAYRPKVDILAQVTPKLAGIDVRSEWYDVDDPTDDDGPIDDDNSLPDDVNNFDNLDSGHNLLLPPTDADGKIRAVWEWTRFHPGNNIRVVLGPARPEEFTAMKALKDDEAGRLFHDLDGDGLLTPPEAVLDHTWFPDNKPITRKLTLWRRLYVEIDMMKAPPPGQVYPDDGIAIDMPPPLSGGALRAPDISLVGPSLERASIQVITYLPNPRLETDQFYYHLLDEFDPLDPNDLNALRAIARRDSLPESETYWTVYVLSAYEFTPDRDNDPDGEAGGALGYTVTDPGQSFIFLETIRDRVYDEGGLQFDYETAERRVVAHEIGHQFLGLEIHVDGSLTAQEIQNSTDDFTEEHIKQIRLVDKP